MRQDLRQLTFAVVWIALLSSVACASAAEPAQNLPSSPGVAISYTSPGQQSLNEPVIVAFKVTNSLSQPVMLDLGEDRKGAFSFTLIKPDGVKVELPRFAREGISRIGKISIRPGETFSQNLLLNEWYEFTQPGKYILRGTLTQPIFTASGPLNEKDKGFEKTLEIGPRDELALTKTCDSLAAKIETSSSYEEALGAAQALSYVRDPIAVAYLRRAMNARKLVEPIAISGLERIANEEAVQALGEGLKADPSDSVRFRAALQHIQKQTDDAQVQKAIDRILNAQ
jgi:hypothetical protein